MMMMMNIFFKKYNTSNLTLIGVYSNFEVGGVDENMEAADPETIEPEEPELGEGEDADETTVDDGLKTENDTEFLDSSTLETESVNTSDKKPVIEKKKITTPYMTKYERARILGTRALQISMSAPVMVELQGETDPLTIAMKELRERKIPITVRRFLPDGSHEDWPVNELIVDLD